MSRKNKRQEIMMAAMRVFCFYGYDGTTLDKVAADAGVSKALVVKYYGTLKNLLSLCMMEFVQELLAKIRKNSEKKGNTLEAHMLYVFELFKLSRPQIRLLLTLFLTPAHEGLSGELLPTSLIFLHESLMGFDEIKSLPNSKELTYMFYACLISYILGGNEERYMQVWRNAFGPLLRGKDHVYPRKGTGISSSKSKECEKMKAYRYISPDSSFVIYPGNGWWSLSINGEKLNDYASPEDAAYDVSAQNTGNTAWDLLEDVDAPDSLDAWESFDYDPQEA